MSDRTLKGLYNNDQSNAKEQCAGCTRASALGISNGMFHSCPRTFSQTNIAEVCVIPLCPLRIHLL
jgi:hypothetical protein